MKNLKTMIAVFALAGVCSGAAVLATTDALARDKKFHQESAQDAQKRLSKQRQLGGTVLDTKTVRFKGSEQENLVVLVQTNKHARRIPVDLGPKQQLGSLNVKKGQKLAVRGVVLNVGDKQVFIADRVKQGDKTAEIDRLAQMKSLKASQSKAATKAEGAQRMDNSGSNKPNTATPNRGAQ